MSIIDSKDVYEIICKTLNIVNSRIMVHGEITGYILYKMLECEHACTEQELVDYTMMGIIHDIGLYREPDIKGVADFEEMTPWPHSIYGFLFLKYLSPMDDKAEIVLYHHLAYPKLQYVQTKYRHIIECLSLADQMDTYMHMKNDSMEQDYFKKYRNIKFSGKALDLFFQAEARFGLLKNLADGSYRKEIRELLSRRAFSEKYKKGFLEMLIYTIDFRSEHTVVHTMSTVNFAVQLGRLMRLSGKDQRNIYYGALLHDLGKIAIPIEILESPGRLSDEDMKIMRGHVQITNEILQGIVDDEVLEIAIRHHEKLDGSGYYRGLTDEELTLPQKIVAVADILSALYGKRSYKEAFESEKIKQIIQGDADNGKISKTVVHALMVNYDQIINNYEKEKEATIGLYLKIKEQFEEIKKRFEHL